MAVYFEINFLRYLPIVVDHCLHRHIAVKFNYPSQKAQGSSESELSIIDTPAIDHHTNHVTK